MRIFRHPLSGLMLLFAVSLQGAGGNEPLDIVYKEDGSSFELSGKMGIVLEKGLLFPEDPSVKILEERLLDFTGYKPVVTEDEKKGYRNIYVRTSGLGQLGEISSSFEAYRITVDPDYILIEAACQEKAGRAVALLASILVVDSDVLTRSEVHAWEIHQIPDVVCRWIYSIPAADITGK